MEEVQIWILSYYQVLSNGWDATDSTPRLPQFYTRPASKILSTKRNEREGLVEFRDCHVKMESFWHRTETAVCANQKTTRQSDFTDTCVNSRHIEHSMLLSPEIPTKTLEVGKFIKGQKGIESYSGKSQRSRGMIELLSSAVYVDD